MHRAVISHLKRVRSLDGLEGATIAILVRDSAQLSRFERFCAARGITDIVRLGDDHGAEPRTVMGRIPYAKGLEYDAVIVMGVNHTFREDPLQPEAALCGNNQGQAPPVAFLVREAVLPS